MCWQPLLETVQHQRSQMERFFSAHHDILTPTRCHNNLNLTYTGDISNPTYYHNILNPTLLSISLEEHLLRSTRGRRTNGLTCELLENGVSVQCHPRKLNRNHSVSSDLNLQSPDGDKVTVPPLTVWNRHPCMGQVLLGLGQGHTICK